MNDTEESILRLMDSLQNRGLWLVAIESVSQAVIALTSFFGNSLLCLALHNSRLLQNVQNYYLLSLAVTDMLCALLCMSLSLVALMQGEWPFGDITCQIQGTLICYFGTVSLVTVAMIAVNRYIKVVKSANLYHRIYCKRNVFLSIAFSWLAFAVVVLIGVVLGEGHVFYFHPGKFICFYQIDREMLRRYILGSYGLIVSTAFSSVAFCYYKVFRKVRAHFVQVANCALHDDNTRAFADEIKITRMLFVTILAFFACWTPTIVIDVLETVSGQNGLQRQVYVFNTLTFFCSSAINSLIYGMMRREYKEAYRNVITCNKRRASTLNGTFRSRNLKMKLSFVSRTVHEEETV